MKKAFFLTLFILAIISPKAWSQQKGYYRFPAVNGNTIIFTAEGDLWKYITVNSQTLRLTSGHGMESHAAISPDGKQVAFIGQYEGPSEVYLMPVDGGIPRRLTWEEGNPVVYQWTSEGKIIYSTSSYSTLPNAQLFLLDPVSGKREKIPLAQADQGTYMPSGILCFTRLRDQGSHTKRYKGGTAQNLWSFDGKTEAKPLTADYTGTSKNPMYYNGRVYFLSDRDGTMNIWSMQPDGSGLKQHTRSAGWDLEDADISDGKIVCQQGADILLYDISSDKSIIPDIKLTSDFDQRRIQWISDPKSKITSVDLSWKGDQIAITARGRVFSIPADGERWSEVTRKYGVRYKNATWQGRENNILMLSDESGEFEVWRNDTYGFSAPVQLTKGSTNLIDDFSSSPDGNYIIYTEKDNRLKLWSAKSGSSVTISENAFGYGGPFSWSSDSRWVAYTDFTPAQVQFIRLYDTKNAVSFQITGDRLDSYHPRFSSDCKWLYFISDRSFNTTVKSPWGARQPEPYYNKTSKIYAVALEASALFPFRDANELNITPADTAKKNDLNAGKEKKQGDKTKKSLPAADEKIPDINTAKAAVYVVPVKEGNIGRIELNNEWLYWSEYNTSDNTTNLNALKITNRKNNESVQVATAISSFTLSGDGKKILIRDRNGIVVLNADGSKPDTKKNSVDLAKWAFTIDPAEDWKQMFRDAWRMERDYFYDRNMHGVDWKKIYDQYYPLVDRISDRYELDDILAQMISELSALHMFVYGGDKRVSGDNWPNGFLGAELERNEAKQGYVIKHIFNTDPDFPADMSPLAKPGLKIKEGDVILSVNGTATLQVPDINALLVFKADQQVRLRLRDAGAREYEEIVRPVSAATASGLRYSEWEYTRRMKTDSLSSSKIGYIHLRAMGSGDYDDFVKGFYPAIMKDGLIIDVRHNRGGNIDSWILEKLMRKAWFYWAPRVGQPYPNMQNAYNGHLVVLTDENTASDGEAFAEGFRRLGMGKVIGTRTWGGEIWLSSGNRLVDNGIATAAENGVFSPEGEWLIEGWGVEPDIKVDNLPHETYGGKDAQLEAGVEYLLKLINEKPVKLPRVPAYPDKSFKY